MDHANMVANATGTTKRPRLSVELNRPLRVPHISEGTIVVDAIVNARITWCNVQTGKKNAKRAKAVEYGYKYGAE